MIIIWFLIAFALLFYIFSTIMWCVINHSNYVRSLEIIKYIRESENM